MVYTFEVSFMKCIWLLLDILQEQNELDEHIPMINKIEFFSKINKIEHMINTIELCSTTCELIVQKK